MTNFRTNQTALKLLGSALATALVLGACGSSEAGDTPETTAADEVETTQAEVEATDSTGESTEADETETGDDTEAAEGQAVVNDVVFDIPEGWTSVNRGEDIEVALEETNPDILTALEANGQLDGLRTATSTVDWIGIPPEGGSVNIVWAPGDEAETPISEVAAGVRIEVENRGFTIAAEETFTSPIGDGVRIAFDTVSPSGDTAGGETRILRVEERLVLMTSDALTTDEARSQLELILDSAEIKA